MTEENISCLDNDKKIIENYLDWLCGSPDSDGCIPSYDSRTIQNFDLIDKDESKNERVYSFTVEAWFCYSTDLSEYLPYPAKPDSSEKDVHEISSYDIYLEGDKVTDFDYQGTVESFEEE